MRRIFTAASAVAVLLIVSLGASAHDTWLQTNTNLVRTGDVVHVDLLLGNHGNAHRDFKIASKLELSAATLSVVAPDGRSHNLKERLVDTGSTPKEGYWTAPFTAEKSGLYLVAHTYDAVMSYAPERAVKSAKTFFVASDSLDKARTDFTGFDRVLGHPLEIVPLNNPVTSMRLGSTLKIRLVYKGKPLAGERVSFIPRGVTLKPGIDERYERMTDADGVASLQLKEANYYLVVAHRDEKSEGGTLGSKPYQFTHYGATMVVYVPVRTSGEATRVARSPQIDRLSLR